MPLLEPPPDLTADDRRLYSTALLSVASLQDRLVHDCSWREPPAGSVAAERFGAAGANDTRGLVMDGYVVIEFASLTASDHLRALNTLIRAPRLVTSSFATLTRGAIEAYAKIHHLLSAADDASFLHRHVSLLHSELRYPTLFDEPVLSRDGEEIDVPVERARLASELTRLNLPAPARTEMTTMVAALLDDVHHNTSGRQTYSVLSAVAHAHRGGVNNFVVADTHGTVSGVGIERRLLTELVSLATLAAFHVVEALVRGFGNQTRHMVLVDAVTQRVSSAVLDLYTKDEKDDEG